MAKKKINGLIGCTRYWIMISWRMAKAFGAIFRDAEAYFGFVEFGIPIGIALVALCWTMIAAVMKTN